MNNLLRLIGRRSSRCRSWPLASRCWCSSSCRSPTPPFRHVPSWGEGASPEQVEQYMDEHGMNDPWPVRYVDYIAGLVQGDLGTYGSRQTPVATAIASALPITMQLTFFGLLLAAIFSFTLGVISALYRDKWPDQIIRVISIAGIATPSFWLAVLLILAVSMGGLTRVFPSSGALPQLLHQSCRLLWSHDHARHRPCLPGDWSDDPYRAYRHG